jgi:hypothetical protein
MLNPQENPKEGSKHETTGKRPRGRSRSRSRWNKMLGKMPHRRKEEHGRKLRRSSFRKVEPMESLCC